MFGAFFISEDSRAGVMAEGVGRCSHLATLDPRTGFKSLGKEKRFNFDVFAPS
jgi:hypothetical protein